MNNTSLVPVNALNGNRTLFIRRIMRIAQPELKQVSPLRLALLLFFMVSVGIVIAGTITSSKKSAGLTEQIFSNAPASSHLR